MYDELVATMRRQCVEMSCGNCGTCVNRQAADAIEELSKCVPATPHGRLIDADALIRELEITEEDDHNGATLLMAVFLEVLKSAPTVIDAEEGE